MMDQSNRSLTWEDTRQMPLTNRVSIWMITHALYFPYVTMMIHPFDDIFIVLGNTRDTESSKHTVVHLQRSSGRCGVWRLLHPQRMENSATLSKHSSPWRLLPNTRQIWSFKIRGLSLSHHLPLYTIHTVQYSLLSIIIIIIYTI